MHTKFESENLVGRNSFKLEGGGILIISKRMCKKMCEDLDRIGLTRGRVELQAAVDVVKYEQ
jgi:hypothetical protein